MIERWKRWTPHPSVGGKYSRYELSSSRAGFAIKLSEAENVGKQVKIIFKEFVIAYRCSYKTQNAVVMEEHEKSYGSSFCADWSFFEVTNSAYLQYLSYYSCGITDQQSARHWVLLTEDYVIDLVNDYEPEVECVCEDKS